MAITVEEYAKSDKVDTATSYGMMHAVAKAGKTWSSLSQSERTVERAQEIAREAVKNEDMFLDKAGTRDLVTRYNETLMERAGDNLPKYLDDVAGAVDGVDFDKVKKGDLSGLNGKTLKDIKAEISASAQKNIGMEGRTIEQDFLHTLKEDPQKFKDAEIHDPQALGPNLMQLIMMFVGALLGIDLSGMMAAGNSQEADKKLAENNLSLSPSAEQKFDQLIPAAQRLKEGRGTDDDVRTVTGFAGMQDDEKKLDGKAKQALGEAVLADVTRLRTGQISEAQMGAHIAEVYHTLAKVEDKEQEKANQEEQGPKKAGGPTPNEIAGGAIANVLTGGMFGPVKTVDTTLENFKNIDFAAVAAFAANMPKDTGPAAMPLPTKKAANAHLAANPPQKGRDVERG